MNGRLAKKIRKRIYGDDGSYRSRAYRRLDTGQIIADSNRLLYQSLKVGYARLRYGKKI